MNRRWFNGSVGISMVAICAVIYGCGASTPAPLPAPVEKEAAYKIGPGDILEVVVWKEPELSGNVEVRPDGMITVPLAGDVNAADRAPTVLATLVSAGLLPFIDNPNVTVRVVKSARSFFLMGNVRAPGMYELRPGQTVVQGIAMGGGFSEFADRGGVRIIREGSINSIEVDYDEIVRGREVDRPLLPNDTIIVP